MKISARNVLEGSVGSVVDGAVNSEVHVTLPTGETVVASITRGSVDRLGLVPGAPVVAIVKAPLVMLLAPDTGYRFSARNQLPGTVSAVEEGAVNAVVTVALNGGGSLTSVVTSSAVAELGLRAGSPVIALFKASSAMLAVAS
ncbi:MAG: TOBE domain-containing protein [Actinobacteria bacterium]|nr:TOBE domain-containing protein [Actinomycetota bacterium]MCG2803710.1 TOBE domain-containing protein [Cellulomonas sp.]